MSFSDYRFFQVPHLSGEWRLWRGPPWPWLLRRLCPPHHRCWLQWSRASLHPRPGKRGHLSLRGQPQVPGFGQTAQGNGHNVSRTGGNDNSRLQDIFENMGEWLYRVNNEGQLRWLGPEKGVIAMAVAAIVNTLWDLRARLENKPVWKVLADMTPEQIISLIDFTWVKMGSRRQNVTLFKVLFKIHVRQAILSHFGKKKNWILTFYNCFQRRWLSKTIFKFDYGMADLLSLWQKHQWHCTAL